ncbi:adenosylcobinamide-phosphate synthase CbiB [uncultured Comamonas sp.]|uniref:adenosylcobinamide-phosphate synthase CbiB n=1 Tax=uncultured Comamonas sp. TaxID=114710 RepID=UPI0025E5329A|nr:adenosylcobinamide-phosphate synthase CbiB [uncultured Comamonas sp.]
MTSFGWTELIGLSLSPLAWLYQAFIASDLAVIHWAANVQAGLLAVLVALLLDRLWGEPPVWLHPVVLMGQLLGWSGQALAPRAEVPRDYLRFCLAALVWSVLAAGFFMVYGLTQFMLGFAPWWLWGLVMGVLLKPLLSWRMLRDEVLAVEGALQQSLPAGRERLSWLVSRDTTQLDAVTVRESAIETLAENLSDSVVAPLFWFALAGLPGAAVYRFANTADAMWGYPGWRGQGDRRRHWQWAGKWAARADDVLNWIPARITALWLALLAGGLSWAGLRRDAAVTPSPNGGWPMGAMARAVGVQLSKPGVYRLNPQGRSPQTADLKMSVKLASKVIAAHVLLSLIAMIFMVLWRGRLLADV